MSKPTKATKFIHAAADRARAGGVSVDWNTRYSTVSIDWPGDSAFLQGDEADDFLREIDALCKRFRSLDEYTAALALAEPIVDTLSD